MDAEGGAVSITDVSARISREIDDVLETLP
jgi:hypothetical protein